jgi:toxin CcdB
MIRQFDVFHSPLRRGRDERPYIVVVQSNRYPTDSRICAPLVAARFIQPDGRLNPGFTIAGTRCHLHPLELITLPLRALKSPLASLEGERHLIIAALDLAFTGV